MRHVCLTLLLLLAAPVAAQTPPNQSITFPETPAPSPNPPTPPDPSSVATLNPTQLYVVTADVPILLLASPQGLVNIAEQPGPVTVHARLVGGSGEFETRTYAAKQVFLVSAVATGRVELLAVPAGATSEKQVLRRLIDCQVGPRPPPDPTPVPPTPTPVPPADPFVAEVRAALAKESAEDQTKAAKLAEYYAWAAVAAANHAGTNKQLWDAMVAKQRELGIMGGFPYVREVVGRKLLPVWPTQVDPGAVTTPEQKAGAAKVFALAAQGVKP